MSILIKGMEMPTEFVDIDGYPNISYTAVVDAPTIIEAEEGE